MRTVYIMRHGETIFNQQKKIQGWCDSPLTEKGRKQALIAGEYFKKHQITFGEAYSSTSERASDTLELVVEMDYQRLKGLKEWNFGRLEAEHEYLNPPLPYKDFFVAFGGEEELDFRERISTTIFEVMKAGKADNTLIVSHGAACRQFMRKWAHTSQVDQQGALANCCMLKFAFEAEQFQLLEIINHDFSALK